MHGGTCKRVMQCGATQPFTKCWCAPAAETQDRAVDFQIFGLTLSQLSYRGTRTTGIIFSIINNTSNNESMCAIPFFLKEKTYIK